jgi:hypothetical protein
MSVVLAGLSATAQVQGDESGPSVSELVALDRRLPGYSLGPGDGCRLLFFFNFLQQRFHVGPQFLARFLLLGR